jgi:GH24 family phage-related lysozyme (muramidase)
MAHFPVATAFPRLTGKPYASALGTGCSSKRNGAELVPKLRQAGYTSHNHHKRKDYYMKKCKMRVSAFAALFFLAGCLYGPVLWADWTAAGDFEFSPDGNGLTITRYKGNAAVVNIPPSIDGIPVTAIGEQAFNGCSSLTSITIPNSVTAIGNYVFYRCDSLTVITIPNSVTAIGNAAFAVCRSLTGITVDAGNSQYRDINGILFSKDGKTLMCYPASKTYTSYTIPDGVTAIGDGAFWDCRSLTSVTLPNSVTAIGRNAFRGCSSLTGITLPNSVTAIGAWAFSDCSSLTGITLPNSVTAIGDAAFSGCSSLTGITIPDGVTAIGVGAFSGCSSLTGITIPDGVTAIGNGAFWDCSSLTGITVDAGNSQYRDINGILFSKDGKTLMCYPASKTYTSYTIPDGVTAIGDGAFRGCRSLTGVTLPNSVTAIGRNAFWNCSSLTGITIPDGVTAIGERTFDGCSSLTDITIPDGVTAIGDRAFSGCSSLSAADREAIRRRFGGKVF